MTMETVNGSYLCFSSPPVCLALSGVKGGEVKDQQTESGWIPVDRSIYLIVAAAHQTQWTPSSSAAQDCNDTWEDLKGVTSSVILSGATDLGIRWRRCSLTGGVHLKDGVLGLEQAQ